MAEPDASLEAVRWALTAYLDPTDAQQAATLWQPMTAGSSGLAGLSRFCRDVAQRFDLQGREAELHLHIIRAMQRHKANGLRVAEPAPTHALAQQPTADDSARVVQTVVLAMQAHAQETMGAAFDLMCWRRGIADQIVRARLPMSMKAQAQAWLLGHEVKLAGAWPVRGAGTQLINAAYVALAEWLGPVKADAGLTRIVRVLEQSNDGALRTVRMYL